MTFVIRVHGRGSGAGDQDFLAPLVASGAGRFEKESGLVMIPSGITADHVRAALKDFTERTVDHRFADSTRFDLLVEGRRYPPKAIVGLAAGRRKLHSLKLESFAARLDLDTTAK